jgi:hypothetical protein
LWEFTSVRESKKSQNFKKKKQHKDFITQKKVLEVTISIYFLLGEGGRISGNTAKHYKQFS